MCCRQVKGKEEIGQQLLLENFSDSCLLHHVDRADGRIKKIFIWFVPPHTPSIATDSILG